MKSYKEQLEEIQKAISDRRIYRSKARPAANKSLADS